VAEGWRLVLDTLRPTRRNQSLSTLMRRLAVQSIQELQTLRQIQKHLAGFGRDAHRNR
jgi:hypothetical protein